jgi:hypothetical protein
VVRVDLSVQVDQAAKEVPVESEGLEPLRTGRLEARVEMVARPAVLQAVRQVDLAAKAVWLVDLAEKVGRLVDLTEMMERLVDRVGREFLP